jgi:hypothetical protein
MRALSSAFIPLETFVNRTQRTQSAAAGAVAIGAALLLSAGAASAMGGMHGMGMSAQDHGGCMHEGMHAGAQMQGHGMAMHGGRLGSMQDMHDMHAPKPAAQDKPASEAQPPAKTKP